METLILLSFFKNSIGSYLRNFFSRQKFQCIRIWCMFCLYHHYNGLILYQQLYLSSELCKTNNFINFFKIMVLAIKSALFEPFSKISTEDKLLSCSNFFISLPIGQILSISDSLNLLLKVEKFFPPNSSKTLLYSNIIYISINRYKICCFISVFKFIYF